jgi:hypothetical protein
VARTFSDSDAFSSANDSRIKCGFELECASEYSIEDFQQKLLHGGFGFTNWNDRPGGNLRASDHYGHGYSSLWNIERDGSIPTMGRYSHQVEFKSPPLPLKETLDWIEKLFPFISEFAIAANKTAGFHTSYSIEGVDLYRQTNFIKLIMMLGEPHIAEELDRGGNYYAAQLLDVIKNKIQENYKSRMSEAAKAQYFRDLLDNNIRWDSYFSTTERYFSINLLHARDNYVEFRLLGGKDYLKKVPQIKRMIARFAYALKVATDPRAYRDEYSSLLYTMLHGEDEDTSIQYSELRWRIETAQSRIVIYHKESNKAYIALFYRNNIHDKIIYDYTWLDQTLAEADKELIRRRVTSLISRPTVCSGIELPLIYTKDLLGEFTYQKIDQIAANNPGTYEWALKAFDSLEVLPSRVVASNILQSENYKAIREFIRLALRSSEDTLIRALTHKILNDPELYSHFVNTHGELIDRESYWEHLGVTQYQKFAPFEHELLNRFKDSDDLGLEDLGTQEIEDVHFEPTTAPVRRRRRRHTPDEAED